MKIQAEKKGKPTFHETRQKVIEAKRAKLRAAQGEANDEEDDNEWGIEIIEEDQMVKDHTEDNKIDVEKSKDVAMEDLMSQFNNL